VPDWSDEETDNPLSSGSSRTKIANSRCRLWGQTRSFGDVRSNVRFARKRTRLARVSHAPRFTTAEDFATDRFQTKTRPRCRAGPPAEVAIREVRPGRWSNSATIDPVRQWKQRASKKKTPTLRLGAKEGPTHGGKTQPGWAPAIVALLHGRCAGSFKDTSPHSRHKKKRPRVGDLS
jgi:hypothetical protein